MTDGLFAANLGKILKICNRLILIIEIFMQKNVKNY